MFPPEKSFFGTIRSVRLRREEKRQMWEELEHFMRSHSVAVMRKANEPMGTWNVGSLLYSFGLRTAVLTASIVLLTTGSVTVVGAEHSLPGDLLYPVKVGVVEEIVAALSVSPEAGADWAVERVERRLQESVRAALMETLDEDAVATVVSHIEDHMLEVQHSVSELVKDGAISSAADVQLDLESSLHAYNHVLRLASRTKSIGPTRSLLVTLSGEVRTAEKQAEKARTILEMEIADHAEYEVALIDEEIEYAEQAISEAEEKIGSLPTDTDTIREAAHSLEQARTLLAESRRQLRLERRTEAFRSAAEADAAAEEARELIETGHFSKILKKVNEADIQSKKPAELLARNPLPSYPH
jgi:hypothetical protein